MSMRFLLLLCVTLLLSGCSFFSNLFGGSDEDEPAELVEFTPTLEVDRVWRVSVGSDAGKAGLKLMPSYADGRVYAVDRKGLVTVVDSQNGDVIERFDTDLNISSPPGVAEGLLMLGTLDGELFTLDARTGDVRWRAPVSSEVLARPLLHDGVVIARCVDGRVFGFDAATGQRLWVYDRSVPLLSLRGNGSPLARGGLVFIGYDGGEVVALRANDGGVIWEQPVSTPEGRTELERLADIDGDMALIATDLYVVSFRGRLASLSVDSGRIIWVKDIASASGVAVSRTRLAITDAEDSIWLVDRRNAGSLWKLDAMARRELTRPVFYGNNVVVADGEGYIHWIDADSGEFVARSNNGGDGVAAPMLVVGTTLYVLDRNGNLSAYRAGAAL
ncbi:MAG: outer membrane protein assembly factor BamB [Wenzhouxiangellaceae bacterium]